MSDFGKTDVGATQDTLPNTYIQAFGPYSPASNGTVNSMSMYTKIASVTFKLLIYGETAGGPGALLAETGDITSVTLDWASGNLVSPLAVTSGTNYYLAMMCQATVTSVADTETETDYYKGSQTYGTEPDPFPSSPTTDNLVKSIYATYTPSGATGNFFLFF